MKRATHRPPTASTWCSTRSSRSRRGRSHFGATKTTSSRFCTPSKRQATRRSRVTPMMYVTYDQAEALSMGDRVVVLAEGRILQTGTPETIYRAPVSPKVARQVGQPRINLIALELRDGNW